MDMSWINSGSYRAGRYSRPLLCRRISRCAGNGEMLIMVASQTMAGWTEGVGRGGPPRGRGVAVVAACAAGLAAWAGPATAGAAVVAPASAHAPQIAHSPAAGPLPGATSAPAFTVTRLADAGAGSLRAAIQLADAAPPGTTTTIRFAVAGTITLASALPAIIRPVTIDGTSAPGYRPGG